MKKVLIITSYFPPETGAASNRIFHLAEGLSNRRFDVSVVTPLPNYPTGTIFKEYTGKFRQTSEENNIKIYRLWIYASNSKNKILRLFAMLSYSFSLIWFFITNKIPKTVIVQSPPLLVAFTCMIFMSNKRQLILNVSDLWPIAGLELGAFKKNFSYRMLERIERFNYNKATMVLGQSEEILKHITNIVPGKKTFLYRNYPDFDAPKIDEKSTPSTKIKMVYAGLLGVAQGIFKLCENLDYSNIEFHIYGAGAETNKIVDFISLNPNLPIEYHGEVKRSELHAILIEYDLTIIPLLNRIYGSVPSKIFEYSKLGLPILYFGGGEGEQIVLENDLGWIAESGNYNALNKVLTRIKLTDLNMILSNHLQNIAMRNFNFELQMKKLVEFITVNN